MMKTNVRNLTSGLLVAAAMLGTELTRSFAQEIHLSDIRAQQPQETIADSDLCQRAAQAPQHSIWEKYAIDPKSLAQDLNTLMERSDDVVLAGQLNGKSLISPNGKSVAMYVEVRVIRSWKGSHHGGDTLTFGVPFGEVSCEPSGGFGESVFSIMPDDCCGVSSSEPFDWVFVLFLRQSRDDEAQWVQGLRPAAGQGVQGVFAIKVPPATPDEPERECSGNHWNWQRCNAYLETSQISLEVTYARDPLAKRYRGMPVPTFFHEVQSVAIGQRSAEEASPR